jgi:ketosteroid isomerase-like protein
MKKTILFCSLALSLFACTNNSTKTKAMSSESPSLSTEQPTVDLPYKAAYSSQFSTDVSDADLKMVLMSYKNWENGNMSELAKEMGDTVVVDMSSGDHLIKANADLMKMWSTYRDSLSSVKINMQAWQKMYATDKKEGYIVTWYDETDTYKNGKVDSASYHDINQVKNGKIIWYSQYKRPKKHQ